MLKSYFSQINFICFPETSCIEEMTRMMACLKKNKYTDSECTPEIQSFLSCAREAVSLPYIFLLTFPCMGTQTLNIYIALGQVQGSYD